MNGKKNSSRYRRGHRWFLLIVHCSLFSLEKANAVQKSFISHLKDNPVVKPKYKKNYRKTKLQEKGVKNKGKKGLGECAVVNSLSSWYHLLWRRQLRHT